MPSDWDNEKKGGCNVLLDYIDVDMESVGGDLLTLTHNCYAGWIIDWNSFA